MPTKKTKTNWAMIDKVLTIVPSALLWGPPGTGKTYAAITAGDPEEVYTVTLTEETPAAELRGHYVPTGKEFKWMDGPAIAAWRIGARLVINEIDRGSGDALSFLYAICDDRHFARLTLPTGETVRPAEGFQVIATTNSPPTILPEALHDRFPVTLHVADVAPGAIEALSADLRSLAQVEQDGRVSTRRWRAFDTLREHVGEDDAAEAIFGHGSTNVLQALKLKRAKDQA